MWWDTQLLGCPRTAGHGNVSLHTEQKPTDALAGCRTQRFPGACSGMEGQKNLAVFQAAPPPSMTKHL